MPDFTVEPEDPQSQKSLNRKLILVGIITVSFVILIILLFFQLFIQTKSSDVPSVEINKASPSATQATPSAQKDETVGWETYSKKEHGFTIKYPSNWFTHDELSDPEQFNRVVFSNEKLTSQTQVNVSVFSWPKSFKLYSAQLELANELFAHKPNKTLVRDGDKITKISELTIEGFPAVRYEIESAPQGLSKISFGVGIQVKGADVIWDIRLYSENKNLIESSKETFDQILSTFNLLD